MLILKAWISKLPPTYFCIHLVPLFFHLLASKADHCIAVHISHSGPLPCCVYTHTSHGPVRRKRIHSNSYKQEHGGVPNRLMRRWDFCTTPAQLAGALRKPQSLELKCVALSLHTVTNDVDFSPSSSLNACGNNFFLTLQLAISLLN